MPRESHEAKRARALKIIRLLKKLYPHPRTILNYSSEFELLIAVILSAQAMDVNVNAVTPHLFKKYPDPDALVNAELTALSKLLVPVGLSNSKAKALKETARMIRDDFGGQVPRTVEELMTLRGVGRKTALVVLGEGFGIAKGIAVDTHVNRLSRLLSLTTFADPLRIEKDLVKLIPQRDWIAINHLLIFHGRAICRARLPLCGECILNQLCPGSRATG